MTDVVNMRVYRSGWRMRWSGGGGLLVGVQGTQGAPKQEVNYAVMLLGPLGLRQVRIRARPNSITDAGPPLCPRQNSPITRHFPVSVADSLALFKLSKTHTHREKSRMGYLTRCSKQEHTSRQNTVILNRGRETVTDTDTTLLYTPTFTLLPYYSLNTA